MTAKKSVMEVALGKLSAYLRRLKDNPGLLERLERSNPLFLKNLRVAIDLNKDGVVGPDELKEAAGIIARLAPVAGEFVRMQSGVGLQIEEPCDVVARVGHMLRDTHLDRSKLVTRFPAFAHLEAGKVSGIALLVDNDMPTVLDALMFYESGGLKGAHRVAGSMAQHARVSGD